MNKQQQRGRSNREAFTLVEMLVVVAVIGILAAMIIPMAGSAGGKATLNRAAAARSQLETALDDYKSKRGVPPPDHTNNLVSLSLAHVNPLFYELAGTVYTNIPPQYFHRLHGAEAISQANIQLAFGIGGFFNSAYVANRNDNTQLQQAEVRDFLGKVDSGNYLSVTPTVQGRVVTIVVLGLRSEGPLMLGSTTTGVRINPWRYVSSNPTHNPGSYDLWIDIIIQGKTNRISNWSRDPEVL